MKGYWIALYKTIHDAKNLKDYSVKVTPVIKSYGGKPLVRGGDYQCLEGEDFFKEQKIFIIDSYGRAVMFFPVSMDPKLILKDLKVLI